MQLLRIDNFAPGDSVAEVPEERGHGCVLLQSRELLERLIAFIPHVTTNSLIENKQTIKLKSMVNWLKPELTASVGM